MSHNPNLDKIEIALSECEQEFLSRANIFEGAGATWYHIPYIFKKNPNGLFEIYKPEDVPDDVKMAVFL